MIRVTGIRLLPVAFCKGGLMQRNKLSTCRYAYEVTDLLARRIKNQNKTYEVTTFPPMGLGATCAISVKNSNKELIGFLQIESDDYKGGFVYLTNRSRVVYPKGSIGDINGFNVVKEPLPTTLPEVINLVFGKGEMI